MSHDPLFGTNVAGALASIPKDASSLHIASELRERLGPELGRRAAELHDLRIRSARRFGEGTLAFVTRKGLEQASAPTVAAARSAWVERLLPGSRVWDATSGIGADSLAMAAAGLALVASDRDLHHVRCTRANLEHRGLPGDVLQADAAHGPVRADVVLLDPDRRAGGGRTADPGAWSPDLTTALRVAQGFEGACLKLPPAFEAERLEPRRIEGAHRWRWVSLRGELAETTLWLGVPAEGGRGEREALALDGKGGEARLSGPPGVVVEPLDGRSARDAAWLAEPDPAVIRAGLIGHLAREEGLRPLAPGIAYLAGDHRPTSPLLRAWRVLGTASLDPRRVRALLREHDVGPLVVKKRGHPDSAQRLAERLRGRGSRRGLLAVARLERGHLALLLEERLVGDEGFEPPTSSL